MVVTGSDGQMRTRHTGLRFSVLATLQPTLASGNGVGYGWPRRRDGGGHITGQVIHVNGGAYLGG